MIYKETIKNNFSRYARFYDEYADMQNVCAQELISGLKGSNFKNILDIGCGTGNFTRILTKKFPKAKIKAVDISGEMIEVAKSKLQNRDIEFIIEDAERIDFNERFDLISSNVAFQWFKDLKPCLAHYKKFIDKNGMIIFSVFGPLTFCELDECLKKMGEQYTGISSCDFINVKKISDILNSLFKDVEIKKKLYRQRYSSITELLKTIKYTGARGNGINIFMTPGKLNKLENIYKKAFGDTIATYEAFFVKVKT